MVAKAPSNPDMPTVVVILPSSTYRAGDFITAAESLGIDLVVASENPPPLDMGDRYLQIDCSSPSVAAEAIADLGERIHVDGVVAADDAGVLVAAEAAAIMGLSGNSPESARATRDKLLMRSLLARSEVDQPSFSGLTPGDDPLAVGEAVGYPLVVKPIDRSASQGVIKVDTPDEMAPAVDRVRDIAGLDSRLLIESYVAGVEVAIEGMLTDGELTVLAVFDKPDTSAGPFFPETIFVTPSRLAEDQVVEAERTAEAAARGLGLTTGPVHVEVRFDGPRARVIEVAARSIGGLCSRSLNFGLTGTTLESLILRNALGTGKTHLRREQMSSGVLMIPTPTTGTLSSVGGEAETRAIPGVTGIDFTMTPGDRVVAPPEGERYLGFVYARADHPEQVETALRKAMATLEVQLEG
jgi:biotin carboxylase